MSVYSCQGSNFSISRIFVNLWDDKNIFYADSLRIRHNNLVKITFFSIRDQRSKRIEFRPFVVFIQLGFCVVKNERCWKLTTFSRRSLQTKNILINLVYLIKIEVEGLRPGWKFGPPVTFKSKKALKKWRDGVFKFLAEWRQLNYFNLFFAFREETLGTVRYSECVFLFEIFSEIFYRF